MSALALRGLTVRRGACPVVDQVDLDAPPGAVTALVGPNGAGKSTLLRAVLGLVPCEGSVRLGDADLRSLSPEQRARRVAYVPQRSLLHAPLPVRAAVSAGLFAHDGWLGGREDRVAVETALTAVDALHLADRGFSTLSAGEQQRVLVARALASGAGCILMDEPTGNLDVGHALALLDLARQLARSGRTVVVVLHHLDDARRIADHAVLLHRGRVLAAGSPGEVIAAGPLREAFRVEPVEGGALGFRAVEQR